jgi:hypothetical protein
MENDDNITLFAKRGLFIEGVLTANYEVQKEGLSPVKISTYPL